MYPPPIVEPPKGLRPGADGLRLDGWLPDRCARIRSTGLRQTTWAMFNSKLMDYYIPVTNQHGFKSAKSKKHVVFF